MIHRSARDKPWSPSRAYRVPLPRATSPASRLWRAPIPGALLPRARPLPPALSALADAASAVAENSVHCWRSPGWCRCGGGCKDNSEGSVTASARGRYDRSMRNTWLALMIAILPACGIQPHACSAAQVGIVTTLGAVGHDPGSVTVAVADNARVAPGTQLSIVCDGKVLCTVITEAQADDAVFCSIDQWFSSEHWISAGAVAQIRAAEGGA